MQTSQQVGLSCRKDNNIDQTLSICKIFPQLGLLRSKTHMQVFVWHRWQLHQSLHTRAHRCLKLCPLRQQKKQVEQECSCPTCQLLLVISKYYMNYPIKQSVQNHCFVHQSCYPETATKKHPKLML